MSNPSPEDELDRILSLYGNSIGALYHEGSGHELDLTEAKAALNKWAVAKVVGELERIKRDCFPDKLASLSGIFALQKINERISELKGTK